MSKKNALNRTVSFWRLVRMTDGVPLAHADWTTILAAWAHQTRNSKIVHTVELDELGGRVHTIGDADHLVITKDRDDVPRQQHRHTGETEEVATKSEDWEVVESSFVMFLDFGNVFGFMQSANTAASPQSVAKWINATNVLKTMVEAQPVLDRDKWAKMRDAGGVNLLEVAGPVSLIRNLDAGPLQYLLERRVDGEYSFKIEIKAKKTKQYRKERAELYAAAEQLSSEAALGRGVRTARARVQDDEGAGIASEMVNFMKQRFSKKETVPVIGGPGERSIQESSAFDAILRVAGGFENELRQATKPPQEAK